MAETALPRIIHERLVAHHRALLDLCRRLERIADSLPDEVTPAECLAASRTVFATVKRAHQYEEETLFPLFREINSKNPQMAMTIERLQFEQGEDESYAEEVAEGLKRFATEENSRNPDTLAYMLRGFFEGMRRHVAFETDHLMPLLKTGEERK